MLVSPRGILGFGCGAECPEPPPGKEGHYDYEYCHDGDVEGPYSFSDFVPVLPQNIAAVGQTDGPGEGAEEAVKHEFP